MKQIFGEFIEELPKNAEYLIVGFSPSSIPLKQRWRNNGLSADFIADYLQTFFVGQLDRNPKHIKNAVKYVANELLENAMKFSDESVFFPTRIAFHLFSEKVVFHVTNSIKPQEISHFQSFIRELLDSDPHELYFKQMEVNAQETNSGRSGLGFLSMICDYSARLGWKFEVMIGESPINTVTTMVSLSV